MGNFITRFFEKLQVEEEADYEEDYEEEEEEEVPRKKLFSSNRFSSSNSKNVEEKPFEKNSPFLNARKKAFEDNSDKIVPLKKPSHGSNQVSILRPKNIKDACKACDYLAEGKAVILNLEGIPESEAQRIMDFVFGTMYAINGEYSQVSAYVFIFVSPNGELITDVEESVKNLGFDFNSTENGDFEIPVLRRDF